MAGVKELAVGSFDDVGFGYARNAVFTSLARIVKCQTRDALTALGGGNGEVNKQVVANLHALRADSIAAFGVFAVERPVDAQFGYLDRTHIGEQVKRLAHSNVCRLDIGPRVALARCGGWAFENDMAGFQFLHDIGRNGAAQFGAALNGQAINHAELNLARLYLVCQQGFQYMLTHTGNHGADAVAAAHADDDFIQLGIIHKIALFLHGLNAGKLAFDYFFKLFTSLFG